MFTFLKKTKAELTHVVWPGAQQTWTWTILILVIAIAIAYFLDVFDLLFSMGIEELVKDANPSQGFDISDITIEGAGDESIVLDAEASANLEAALEDVVVESAN